MKTEPLENPDIKRLELFVLVTPVIGCFPALWTLYRSQSSPENKAASRLAITLALTWVLGSILLQAGSNAGEFSRLPLLLTHSLLTTSYFIVGFGLMVRIWKRQPLWLPGISSIAEKMRDRNLP